MVKAGWVLFAHIAQRPEEEIDLGEEPLEDEMSEELPLDDEDEDVDYLDKSDDLLGNSGDDYDER